jgi:hypothetical protein
VLTSPLRVLPDFLIIGAQKAGTTSLFQTLSSHPGIAGAAGKEVHFFDYNFQRGERWYRAHFPTVLARWSGRFKLAGEASPFYVFHPLTPARVAQFAPQAKLIVLLRHPVERAYSHYHHQVRLGLEPLTFVEALDQEAERLIGEFEKLLADATYYSFNYQNYSYLARGMYADQLTRWFRFFPRYQFLILKSEDYYADPEPVVARVLEFLDLPAGPPLPTHAVNTGDYEPLKPALREALVDFFAPHNERLYDLLDRDFGWD